MQELESADSSNSNRGIFANIIGIGKTVTILLILFISYLYTLYYLKILDNRKNRNTAQHNTIKIRKTLLNSTINLTGINSY